MDDQERRALLKEEYLQLQGTIDSLDERSVSIKAWGVTFGLASIVGAYAAGSATVLVVAALGALMFWVLEAYWKTFQQAHLGRSQAIEEAFAAETTELAPLQIRASWLAEYEQLRGRGMFNLMRWPNVALPHVVVSVLAFLLLLLHLFGVLPIEQPAIAPAVALPATSPTPLASVAQPAAPPPEPAVWAIAVGFLYTMLVGHLVTSRAVPRLWEWRGEPPEQRAVKRRGHWLAPLVGHVERALYLMGLLAGAPLLIGVWLGLKVAGTWKIWQEGISYGDEAADASPGKVPTITGHSVFMIFLIGSGLSLLFSLVGYALALGLTESETRGPALAVAAALPLAIALLGVWTARQHRASPV